MPDPSMNGSAIGTTEPPAAQVSINGTSLNGQLSVPASPIGFMLIPKLEHGGPPPEAYLSLAAALRAKRLATLLVTLPPPQEAKTTDSAGWLRPDVAFIAGRIATVVQWASRRPETAGVPAAVFGIDTVAAGALIAAAEPQPGVAAVIGFNARTDLVDRALGKIAIPALLIASSRATDVLIANRAALAEMRCEKRLVIAPGNLKESLDGRAPRKIANVAARWFERQIVKHPAAHGMR